MAFDFSSDGLLSAFGLSEEKPSAEENRETYRRNLIAARDRAAAQGSRELADAFASLIEKLPGQTREIAQIAGDSQDRGAKRFVNTATAVQPIVTRHATDQIKAKGEAEVGLVNADVDGRLKIIGAVGDNARENRNAFLGDPLQPDYVPIAHRFLDQNQAQFNAKMAYARGDHLGPAQKMLPFIANAGRILAAITA